MTKTALLIAKNWPEPNSTAAGRRTLDLLQLIKEMDFDIHVASAAEPTPFQIALEPLGFKCHSISVNESAFDTWISKLQPDLVIYDRFIMEEQFNWRVKEQLPNVMTLLDTSDLHCLRVAREQSVKKNLPLNLKNDTAIREITSILRCDLTLMISEVEIEILVSEFAIAAELLVYMPFLVEPIIEKPSRSFEQRQHLIMMGGFKHEPNRDATRWLRQTLWPILKNKLPANTEVHVFGAYSDHAMNQLNAPKEKFFIKGRADSALDTIEQYRINLAPLRFGAGQKGKILEGWLTGTPTLTTPIGAESMATDQALGYTPSNEPEIFSQQIADTYNNQELWSTIQSNGYQILNDRFMKSNHSLRLTNSIKHIFDELAEHRQRQFMSRLLWQNNLRASEYMSRWIELKNQIKSSNSTTD